ncbi:MAG: energy transducer TonB [Acidobacteria bacterium]|nr:energy transducer TonB [Acidobacteriota bacterium]
MFSEIGVSDASPVRRTTTLVAFSFEVAACAAALVFPLLYPRSLPSASPRVLVRLSDAPSIEAEPVHGSSRLHRATRIIAPLVLTSRSFSFGNHVVSRTTDEAVAPSETSVLGNGRNLHFPVDGTVRPLIPAVPLSPSLPRSVVMQGNLIRRVEPLYPALARQLGIQGGVVIRAVISREGTIEHAEVSSGPELLRSAALEAVRRWKYRPYYLNGRAVEVETEITVNFILRR